MEIYKRPLDHPHPFSIAREDWMYPDARQFDIRVDIMEWVEETMPDRYILSSVYFHFELESDAIAFKLRWG